MTTDKSISRGLAHTTKQCNQGSDECSSQTITLTSVEFDRALGKQRRSLVSATVWKLHNVYGLPYSYATYVADESVQESMVAIWSKKRPEDFTNENDIWRWLKAAIRISLSRWEQQRAREWSNRAYPVPIEDDDGVTRGDVIEPWDQRQRGAIWRELDEQHQSRNDASRGVADDRRRKAEVDWNLTRLPKEITKLVDAVYQQGSSWEDLGHQFNLDPSVLRREVQRWLKGLRPYLKHYKPRSIAMPQYLGRQRKSHHCPLCDAWISGHRGAVCKCGVAIPRDQFVAQYSYRKITTPVRKSQEVCHA